MPPGLPPLGAAVLGRFTKWGEGRHWEWVGRYLGSDEFGHWWYAPVGTRCVRPGVDFVETDSWVSLVPHEGAYAAGFYPAHREIRVYVDMTTRPVWQRRAADDGGPEWEVTMVDLDLDVVLTRDGQLFVDDEDEFAEHRVTLGYPDEIVLMAAEGCEEVRRAVSTSQPPYDGTAERWLALLDAGVRG